MKLSIRNTITIVIASIGGLLLGDSARAAVVSTINSPAGSFASISFVDTNSLDPSLNPGNNFFQNITPWGGAAPIGNTLALSTSGIGDLAKGNIMADVIGGNYSLSLNSVLLNQAVLNTGYADLIF